MASKLEINIRTLIVQCEDLVKEDAKSWLLKNYIKSLDTMIKELEVGEEKPKASAIDEYKTRCKTLKEQTNYVEPSKPLNDKGKRLGKSLLDSNDHVMREMNQIQDSKYAQSLRRDLLGVSGNDFNNSLRQRVKTTTAGSGEDMNEAMKHHANVQEKIAEDMLALTRNLKEQTQIANQIIRKDTEIVTKSTNLTDTNFDALSKEATILKDHSKRACKCWLWIMIGVVMVIFIFMVLFMKVMKKRAS